jgi:carboxyl-terminal processing protease
VLREGSRKLQQITLFRARITLETVIWRLYDGGIGYIRLNDFSDNATEEFSTALRKMDANNLNGLVFDLRDDPGGGLQTAIEIASQFIQRGVVVIQRGKPGTDDIVYRATGDALAPTVPLVVLINEGSASASELVSGALRDYDRAIIVGTRSYGKGSVQTWRQISNGGGLRITIAHFFTPKNGVVNGVGLTPDIVVDWTPEQQDADPNYDPQLQEALWILRGKF